VSRNPRAAYISDEVQALHCPVCAGYEELNRYKLQDAFARVEMLEAYQRRHTKCLNGEYKAPEAKEAPRTPAQAWREFMDKEYPTLAGTPATPERA